VSAVQAGGAATTALRAAMEARNRSERLNVVGVDVLSLRAVSRANGLLVAGASGGVLSVIILLIAIANSSNLLLARSVSRRREIGIRLSMGGGRARVLRQLLTESLLIALLAALCGAVLVLWAARAFDSLMPMALDISPHWRTFAFTGGIAAVTGVLFGVLPAIYTVRIPIFDVLKSGAGSVDIRRSRLQGAFVAVQLALTLPLLTGPAMLLAEARAFATADLGIDADRVFGASLLLERAGLNGQQTNALLGDVRERIAALPGVSAVSVANAAPLFDNGFRVRAFTRPDRPDDNSWRSDVVAADESYFELLDIDVLAGRAFDRADVSGGAPVVIVSEAFARAVWPAEDAIGRQLAHIHVRREVQSDGTTKLHRNRVVSTVVGVVESVRLELFGDGSQPRQPGTRRSFDTPIVYFPRAQQPDSQRAVVLVRSAADVGATLSGLRTALKGIDQRVAVETVTTLEARRHDMLWAVRRIVGLLMFVGALAVLLACVGVYSVISYAVRQRTRDIAVRMAVGARASQVAGMFFRRGVLLTVIGIAFGAPLTALARYIVLSTGGGLASQTMATASIVLGVVLLLAVAAIASWLPARRAAGVDPLVALRVE
jgi:predicted permease